MHTNNRQDSDDIFSFLVLIHRKLSKPLEDYFKGKFTSLQFNSLCVLYAYGSMTMTELARIMHTPKQQMTKMIDRLVEEGHIIRTNDSEDRRCIRISISKETAEYIAVQRRQFLGLLNGHLQCSAAEDYDEFFNSIRSINRILRKFPKNIDAPINSFSEGE